MRELFGARVLRFVVDACAMFCGALGLYLAVVEHEYAHAHIPDGHFRDEQTSKDDR
jgi:hypothetical protein